MSTYKVIQDIEAEDKLVGPLSLRQFLYAIAAVVGGYLCFLSVQKGAPFLLIVFAPITAVLAFFAAPWKKEQSTEVWALAHLRFFLKPHVRIWNQGGERQYVEIIAQKHEVVQTTNGLSPDEVQSRLKALANTIDTHGWAVKGATAADLSQVDPLLSHTTSDRLVGSIEMPREAMSPLKIQDDIAAHEDMLDESNHVAKKLDSIISRETTERHDRLIKQVQQESVRPAQPAIGTVITAKATADGPATNQWFVNAPGVPGAAGGPTNITIITPGTPLVSSTGEPTADEQALAEEFKSQNDVQQPYYNHLHVVEPLGAGKAKGDAGHGKSLAKAKHAHKATGENIELEPAPETSGQHKAVLTADSGAPAVEVAATAPKAHAGTAHHIPKAPTKVVTTPPAPLPAEPDPAIIGYANNDDLDIATIARQMSRRHSPNEVEIRLH